MTHDIVRPRSPRSRARRALLVGALVPLALLGAACGGDDDEAVGADDGGNDATTEDTLFDQQSLGVPEECIGAYPFAMEAPDPDEISLAPAGWPAPPEGATLCVTSETIGSETEVAEYATSATDEEVLAYYEAELGGFELAREAGVGREILTGYDDTVGFQIQPTDAGFKVVFATL
jgi:hypothetical protein